MIPSLFHRFRVVSAITLVLVLGVPRLASANIPLPATFAFHMPLWMSSLTFGLLFLAVGIIEMLLLRSLLKVGWQEAFALSFGANAVSTLAGGIMAASSCAFILCIVLLGLVPVELQKRWGWNPWLAAAFGFFPIVCLFLLAGLFWMEDLSLTHWAIYGPLLPAFLLTVLIECLVIRRWYGRGPLFRPVVLSNLATYAMLVVILVAARVGPRDNPMLSDWSLRHMAVKAAREGNVEKALSLLRWTQERYEQPAISNWFRRVEPECPKEGYCPQGELLVAKALVARGEYDVARRLIQETLELDLHEQEGFRTDLTNLLARIPDAPTSSAIAGSPPPPPRRAANPEPQAAVDSPPRATR